MLRLLAGFILTVLCLLPAIPLFVLRITLGLLYLGIVEICNTLLAGYELGIRLLFPEVPPRG